MGTNLTDTYDWVVSQLDAAGLSPITDPRNVRPPCILVEPPSVTANQSRTYVELTFPITLMAPPPGNRDATLWLLSKVDDVLDAIGPTEGAPAVVTVGNQDLPAYQLSARIQIRRD